MRRACDSSCPRSRCSWPSRPPRAPRSRTSKPSTRTAPRAATCSTGTGCSGSTTKTRASSSASCARRRPRGWTKVKVPNVWNLGDASNESMSGGIGWYRKDFELPNADSALAWAFRFESVNYRATVWLNGKPIGENTGAYVPFEIQPSGFKRRGTNRLVVRVDSKRRVTDFPPAGLNTDGVPTGGWWNYSGIQREVYLRKLDTVDFRKVLVRPVLPCGDLRRDDPGPDQPQERHPPRTAGDDHGQVRQPEPAAGDEDDRPRRDHGVRGQHHRPQPAPVGAGQPEPLRRQLHGARRRREGRGLRAQERHPLDQGLQRPPDPQRAGAQHARARPARGLQGPGLRDRQRAPRGAASPRPRSSARQPAHALPDAPLHARAGGPRGAC